MNIITPTLNWYLKRLICLATQGKHGRLRQIHLYMLQDKSYKDGLISGLVEHCRNDA